MSQHHQAIDRWRWAKVAKQAIARAGGQCQIPDPHNCTGIATQGDHIVPLSQGGAPYDLRNVRAACGPGNRARNRKVPTLDTGGHW